jgi:hypothetical protein
VKQKRLHRVKLDQLAVAVLGRIKDASDDTSGAAYVFPADSEEGHRR